VSEGAATRLIDVLHARARELVSRLDADACVISRVLGDVLIIVAQATSGGDGLDLGQGFLVSDYPLTQRVLAEGDPASLTLADETVDDAEARLLVELGFGALLMLPLHVAGERWGLVEVYRREPQPFAANAFATATELARVG
jgi:transcriptional regulator with GAF, ATPase, and Fis domain